MKTRSPYLCISFFTICLIVMLFNACAWQKTIMKTLIDLTHSFDEHTVAWPTEKGFVHEKEIFGQTDQGYFYASYRFCGPEHAGTHIDAPIHFNEKGQTLDQIPLQRLIGPGVVVDVS